MIEIKCAQRSPQWYAERCGAITMSNADALLAGASARETYIMKVAAERVSGIPTQSPQTRAIMRGIELEPFAREAVQEALACVVRETGILFTDETKKLGASPDGIIGGMGRIEAGIEILCPLPHTHMQIVTKDAIPRKKWLQAQGNMLVSGAASWYFASFCPEIAGMPLFLSEIFRSESAIDDLRQEICDAEREIARAIEFFPDTSCLHKEICERAIAHLRAVDGEVLL